MPTLKNLSKSSSFFLHRYIGGFPFPYFLIHQRLTDKPELATAADTELVIEGYPRSANSFAVVAFEQAQDRPVRIAHHLHVPAQIIRAVKNGIPSVLLLREPVSAICSLVVREPAITLNLALWDYVRFHRMISPYRDNLLIARFEDVTEDFGTIIARINDKWGTDYHIFEHTKENVARAFDRLEQLETDRANAGTNEDRVARPSAQRAKKAAEIRKRLLSQHYARRLGRARDVYKSLLS